MLKHALATVMGAALLATVGAGHATTRSPYPSSANETTPFSFPAEGMRKAHAAARMNEAPYPSSANETAPFSIPVKETEVSTRMLYGSSFPSSANEVGGTL